jgi:hypothetical protein
MIEKKSPRTIHDEGGDSSIYPRMEKGSSETIGRRDARRPSAVVTLLGLRQSPLGGFDFDNEAGFVPIMRESTANSGENSRDRSGTARA